MLWDFVDNITILEVNLFTVLVRGATGNLDHTVWFFSGIRAYFFHCSTHLVICHIIDFFLASGKTDFPTSLKSIHVSRVMDSIWETYKIGYFYPGAEWLSFYFSYQEKFSVFDFVVMFWGFIFIVVRLFLSCQSRQMVLCWDEHLRICFFDHYFVTHTQAH